MATSRAPGTRSASKAASEETPSLEASLIATVAPVMRHLVAHARRRRAWSELTYQQYNVLRMIDTMGPQPQAERRTDPKDRRTVLLALTPTGRRRARAMRRDLLEAARDLLEPIPEERRASIGSALEELQVLVPEHSARR